MSEIFKLPEPYCTDYEECGTDGDGNSIHMDVPLYTGDQLIAAYEAGKRHIKDGHYVIRYNDDGEFGQATGWLYREGGDPCAVTGRPVYVWRRLAGLIGGCGCRLGECESKPASCRMAYEAATRDPGVM